MNRSRVEISAIIISFNGRAFLPDCLSTLCENLTCLTHEIIVVDNGSTDGSLECVKGSFPEVKVIENGANLGFARAVNIGIRETVGDYLFILNQDLRFRPATAQSLLNRLKSDTRIGMIGPKFIGFDGRLQHSARAFPTYRQIFYEALLLAQLFPTHREFASWRMGWFDHQREMFVDQPMGSAMLIPRAVIEKIGLFDERFPIFFNDVDYCRRIRDAGYKSLYYPDAVVEHYQGGSVKRYPVRMKVRSLFSFYRYLRKYARPSELPLLWLSGLVMLVGLVPLLLITSAQALITRRPSTDPTAI
jgi:GT2 family glycosyltransferase